MMSAALRLVENLHESIAGMIAERGVHQRARATHLAQNLEAGRRGFESYYVSRWSNLVDELAGVESHVRPHVPNHVAGPHRAQHRIAELLLIGAIPEQRPNERQQSNAACYRSKL